MAQSNATFLTIAAFKAKFGVDSMEVLHNAESGKNFVSMNTGDSCPAQGSLNVHQEMKFITDKENPTIEDFTLINVKPGSVETLATL